MTKSTKMTREEALSRMHELIPYHQWLTLNYIRRGGLVRYPEAFSEGQPFVNNDTQGFCPLSRQRVAQIKEWLDLCLELYPPEAEIDHANYRYCGNDACEHCYERERARGYRGGHLQTKSRPGFVVLFKVKDKYGLFASVQPEKRLRALEREWSEPLQMVHSIETNDQTFLKDLWESNFIDFRIRNDYGFFSLPERAINTFRSCRFQEIGRIKSWKDNMGAVDLYDITQLRRLVAQNQQQESFSLETGLGDATNSS